MRERDHNVTFSMITINNPFEKAYPFFGQMSTHLPNFKTLIIGNNNGPNSNGTIILANVLPKEFPISFKSKIIWMVQDQDRYISPTVTMMVNFGASELIVHDRTHVDDLVSAIIIDKAKCQANKDKEISRVAKFLKFLKSDKFIKNINFKSLKIHFITPEQSQTWVKRHVKKDSRILLKYNPEQIDCKYWCENLRTQYDILVPALNDKSQKHSERKQVMYCIIISRIISYLDNYLYYLNQCTQIIKYQPKGGIYEPNTPFIHPCPNIFKYYEKIADYNPELKGFSRGYVIEIHNLICVSKTDIGHELGSTILIVKAEADGKWNLIPNGTKPDKSWELEKLITHMMDTTSAMQDTYTYVKDQSKN